ncbi:hypothetical protein K3495_g5314 [Podosphaera aphanis]|nr:hypothetical protein K3495_g5314 [Podosphaera aphanis]
MLNGSITRLNSGNAQRSWDEKAREVLAVINGSCSRTYKEECTSFSDSLYIKGLWDKLTAANPSNYPRFEKIQDVVNRLNEIKIKLAPTENRLADQRILSQLIHSLPQDDLFWRAQGTHILTSKSGLQDAVLHLKSCETDNLQSSTTQANNACGAIDNKKNRGGRYRQKQIKTPNERERTKDYSRRASHGSYRGRDGPRLSGHENYQCRFCQLTEQADKNRNERGSRQIEYLARTDDQSNENDWPYPSAAPCVTGQALLSLSKLETIIDSGATEHFSGQCADFTSLKRWHEPRTVLVADGKEVLCEGTGTIELKTPKQTLILNGVWYVPKFQRVRLISVFSLNDAGIEAQVVNHRSVLWKGNTKLISVSGSNGLYKSSETSSSPDSSAYIGSSKCAPSVELTSADLTTYNPMPNVQEPITASTASILLHDSQLKRNIPNDKSVWTLHHRRLGHCHELIVIGQYPR